MLCNVTGTLYLPNGQLGKSLTLRFKRADQSVTAEYLGAVVPNDVYTQSDKSGQVDFEILTGVYVMHVEGGYSVRAIVPDAATADIADCIDAAAIPDQPPVWYQQALNARDEAEDAADRAEDAASQAAGAVVADYFVATDADRLALSPSEGETAYVSQTGHTWKWQSGAWVDMGVAPFAFQTDLDAESVDRRSADSIVGVIPLTNAIAVPSGDETETVITADVRAAATAAGVSVNNSTVKLVVPNGVVGNLRLHVDGDIARNIMNERNAAPMSAEQVTVGSVLLLERRAGNWVTIAGAVGTDMVAAIRQDILDQTADKISNDRPENTDAGLMVEDRDGKVLLRADEDGTWLAGRDEPIERTLDLLTLPVVRPTVSAPGLDIRRLTSLTPESQAALAQGLATRGGRIAPVPTCVLPQPVDWGTEWLASQRVAISPETPRINADPFYRENVGLNEFVHPHVMHFPHGFLGYEYLMCINPYPGGNDQMENPILYGSHDMINWHLFTHFDQPLADASRHGDGNNFLSDNTLIYDPLTGELICLWRRHLWTGQFTTYEYRSTLDGIHWSPIRICYENINTEAGSAAPAMVYNPTDGLWYLFFSSGNRFMCRTKRDFRNLDEPWSAPVDTGVGGWHCEVRVLGDRLWMFSCTGTNNIAFLISRSLPGDWTQFSQVRNTFVDPTAFVAEYGYATTYKNSLVPHLYDDGTAQVKCLIQCRPSQSQWWMFYAETARMPIGD